MPIREVFGSVLYFLIDFEYAMQTYLVFKSSLLYAKATLLGFHNMTWIIMAITSLAPLVWHLRWLEDMDEHQPNLIETIFRSN